MQTVEEAKRAVEELHDKARNRANTRAINSRL
jgi:hypothetical protein